MRYKIVPNANGTSYQVEFGSAESPALGVVDGFDTKVEAMMFIVQLLRDMYRMAEESKARGAKP